MRVVEFLYHLGYAAKKRIVLARRKRLPAKVISIGNLTVGGTGKTPAAIAVAEEAKNRGYQPIILTRGYMGNARGPCFVSDGADILLNAEQAGDEPLVMARRLKNVPVVKSADRYEGGLLALRRFGDSAERPLLFILDDGFQHWMLHRDADVVLVDGQTGFGNGKMLPVGPLRGPLSELKDADILVITKTRNEQLADNIRKVNPEAPIFFATHEITGLVRPDGETVDRAVLKNKKVLAFCGIANPGSFRKTISRFGCEVVELRQFRDHHRYNEKELRNMEAKARELGAEFLLTTEKDMVKLIELSSAPANLLSVEIGFCADAGFYEQLFKLAAG
ncbi:MAG TPA: tetraacyldisaccharide 4'-kinase [Dissulfurispiraceae bacterium]|nr:tetraacyldisaccharide 4'-kinase [Dissulfurispiraceae bacterium]